MLIAGLVKIFDGRFVDEGADAAVSYFDGVRVVPLDSTLDAVPIFQDEDHVGLGVHLFLQVKRFGVRALGASVCRWRLLVD